jgi:ABC-type Fe3+-citrate transport system substrate-binding protein
MMGMIAQEVQRVAPELVFQNEKDGYYGINYGETTGLLVEAIKEQQKTIQEQTKVVARQGQEIMVLLKELNNLKQQLKIK